MLTDKVIEAAKLETQYKLKDRLHEHNDCIRIAYEWLDAQAKTIHRTRKTYALKHMIESWAGRYVSTSDVEVAAHIHPNIHGTYPHFNISARLTEPSRNRLEDVGQAFTQGYNQRHQLRNYARHE